MRTNGLLATLMFVTVLGFGQVDPYLAGRACMDQNLYASAVSHLEEALELNRQAVQMRPQDPLARSQLGQTYQALLEGLRG